MHLSANALNLASTSARARLYPRKSLRPDHTNQMALPNTTTLGRIALKLLSSRARPTSYLLSHRNKNLFPLDALAWSVQKSRCIATPVAFPTLVLNDVLVILNLLNFRRR